MRVDIVNAHFCFRKNTIIRFWESLIYYNEMDKIKKASTVSVNAFLLWDQRDSNPRPSACKADALNQLSYDPFCNSIANIHSIFKSQNKIQIIFKLFFVLSSNYLF